MSDEIVDRHVSRLQRSASGLLIDADTDADESENFGAFGWLRGVRDRAPMLELRKRSGNILAIGYGWLERCECDPSASITLLAAGLRIRITGRNLDAELQPGVRLFNGIARHRVTWVAETRIADSIATNTAPCHIECIDW